MPCLSERDFADAISSSDTQAKLLAYARSLTPTGYEDLLQNMWIKALRNRERFDGSNLIGWLKVMCRRMWLSEMRRDTLRKKRVNSWDFQEGEYILKGVVDHGMNLDAAPCEAAVAKLPELYRGVAEMRIRGHPYASIAQALDIREGTARTRMHVVRDLLREEMGDELPESFRTSGTDCDYEPLPPPPYDLFNPPD